jgi:hypothetical protein
MKVTNMKSSKGNIVPNQFIIKVSHGLHDIESFQSYSSVIVEIHDNADGSSEIKLDVNKWNYSVTTSRYRNQFLNETTKETKAKIKSGEYILTNLNE